MERPSQLEASILPIDAIYCLYISSQASSTLSSAKLAVEGITHIVFILTDAEITRLKIPTDIWTTHKTKRIAIEDDPHEDILAHLGDVHQWISNAFKAQSKNRVLIHSHPDLSRSGAFIVAYIMKALSMSYHAALTHARASNPHLTPNRGFEQQLQTYELCNYDVILPVSRDHQQTSAPPLLSTLTSTDELRTMPKVEKPAHMAWKACPSPLAHQAQETERNRTIAMANMAAEYGRRRMAPRTAAIAASKSATADVTTTTTTTTPDTHPAGGAISEREDQWRRVEAMEKAWNEKLIRGDVERARENGELGSLMAEVFGSVGQSQWQTFVTE